MNPITKQYEYEWIQQWGNTIEEEEESVSEVLGKDEDQEDHVLVHDNEGGSATCATKPTQGLSGYYNPDLQRSKQVKSLLSQ